MIKFSNLVLDPQKDSEESIKKAFDQYVYNSQDKIWVVWKDYSLNQESVRELYLPYVQYAQSLGHPVYCIMPHNMASHLVKNKKLMFVDPAFLNEFKFKEIQFTLPYSPKYKPKSVKTSQDL